MERELNITRAGVEDISELYALQLLAFESEAEMIGSRDDFVNWITLKLTSRDDEILGAVRYRPQGGLIEVGRLMTHPDYRRQGIAQRLMAEVDKAHPRETKELYTCTKSWINIRLYEKIGYRAVKEVTEDSGLSFVYMRKT